MEYIVVKNGIMIAVVVLIMSIFIMYSAGIDWISILFVSLGMPLGISLAFLDYFENHYHITDTKLPLYRFDVKHPISIQIPALDEEEAALIFNDRIEYFKQRGIIFTKMREQEDEKESGDAAEDQS